MSRPPAAILATEALEAQVHSFYRPGLDILRALAFLLVFVAHGLLFEINQSNQFGAVARPGEFGVSIFFFLSSYLITELLLREKRDTGTIDIKAFYVRRILRIWPLYFIMIAVGWFYGLFSPSHTLSLAWGASLLLLFTNWYTVGHGYPPGFLFPLWSISVEEQFYLVWPCIVKYLSRGALLGVASGLMTAAYLTLKLLLDQHRTLDPAIWANSLVQFQFFAWGLSQRLCSGGASQKFHKVFAWLFFFLVCFVYAPRKPPSIPATLACRTTLSTLRHGS